MFGILSFVLQKCPILPSLLQSSSSSHSEIKYFKQTKFKHNEFLIKKENTKQYGYPWYNANTYQHIPTFHLLLCNRALWSLKVYNLCPSNTLRINKKQWMGNQTNIFHCCIKWRKWKMERKIIRAILQLYLHLPTHIPLLIKQKGCVELQSSSDQQPENE